jgi:hypothetical protein
MRWLSNTGLYPSARWQPRGAAAAALLRAAIAAVCKPTMPLPLQSQFVLLRISLGGAWRIAEHAPAAAEVGYAACGVSRCSARPLACCASDGHQAARRRARAGRASSACASTPSALAKTKCTCLVWRSSRRPCLSVQRSSGHMTAFSGPLCTGLNASWLEASAAAGNAWSAALCTFNDDAAS